MANTIKIVAPTGALAGTVHLPISKSICNRLLILSKLAGHSFPQNLLSSADDSQLLFQALNAKQRVVNVKNAGTAFRFLTAYFSGLQGREVVLTGNKAMQKRPIGPLVNALKKLGADISYIENDGFPPLRICGKPLQGGSLKVKADVSSQYISALMMVGTKMPKGLTIELDGAMVSSSYFEMTGGLMKRCGVAVTIEPNRIHIPQSQVLNTQFLHLENDWSAASYFYGLVALIPGSKLLLRGLKKDSLQGDSHCAVFFEQLGVRSDFVQDGVLISSENMATSGRFHYELSSQPDLVQTLACVHAARGDEVVYSGIAHLRFKETDRIAALQNELGKLGVTFSKQYKLETETWLQKGKVRLNAEPIKTYGDHRMAMAFCLLSVRFSALEIENAQVVEKSFPKFWDELRRIGFVVC